MLPMNGKVALVTGASSGIGYATAKCFAERGAKVVAAARREEQLASLVAEITEAGGEATSIRTDVVKAEEAEAMVAHAMATFGRLDYCVNNAGVEGVFAPITEMAEEEWDRLMDINVKGNWLCLKYEARAMLEAGHGGAIVNVGSVNSFLGFAGGTAYATSKHAQLGLTSSASAELAPQGIRVNIVCPGFVKTEMHARIRGVIGDEGMDNYIAAMPSMGRAAEADEISRTIVWLCSDDASYITGQSITPDGGIMGSMG